MLRMVAEKRATERAWGKELAFPLPANLRPAPSSYVVSGALGDDNPRVSDHGGAVTTRIRGGGVFDEFGLRRP